MIDIEFVDEEGHGHVALRVERAAVIKNDCGSARKARHKPVPIDPVNQLILIKN